MINKDKEPKLDIKSANLECLYSFFSKQKKKYKNKEIIKFKNYLDKIEVQLLNENLIEKYFMQFQLKKYLNFDEISKKLKLPKHIIHYRLKMMEIDPDFSVGRKNYYSSKKITYIKNYANQYLNFNEIAKKLNLPIQTIKNRIKMMEIEPEFCIGIINYYSIEKLKIIKEFKKQKPKYITLESKLNFN
jgi:hypothetical protein